MNKKFNLVSLMAVSVLFSAMSFYLGISYQKTKIINPGMNREMMREGMARGDFVGQVPGKMMRGGQGNQIMGEIIKINEQDLTIKLNDGGSSIVYVTDETVINQMEQVNKDRLETGQKIIVTSSSQENQNIVAESIQIR